MSKISENASAKETKKLLYVYQMFGIVKFAFLSELHEHPDWTNLMSFLQRSDNFISFPNHQKSFRVASNDVIVHGKSWTRSVDKLAVLTYNDSGVWIKKYT